MAAIDKTYVNKAQLLEAIEWCKKIGTVKIENGYEFAPLDWIYGYNDLDNPHYFDVEQKTYILWNTPQWFDRWLWLNCPLKFVKERLEIQYGDEGLKEFETYVNQDPKCNLDFGKQHYKFLKTPKWRGHKWWMSHGRKYNPWPGKCIQLTYMMDIKAPKNSNKWGLDYNCQTDTWEEKFGLMPTTPWSEYIWQDYHKRIPNKKSIIRELRRWYIPKGYIVRLYNIKYVGLNFEILVK